MVCPECGKKFFRYRSKCPACRIELGENGPLQFWLGAAGALIGALSGFVAIVLFDLGSIPMYLAGLAVGLGIPIGWRFMGERLTKRGIAVCVLLMILTVYCANRTALAIAFMRWLNDISMTITFPRAFGSVPGLIRGDLVYGGRDFAVNPRIYYNRLVLTCAVTAVGGYAFIAPVWEEDRPR